MDWTFAPSDTGVPDGCCCLGIVFNWFRLRSRSLKLALSFSCSYATSQLRMQRTFSSDCGTSGPTASRWTFKPRPASSLPLDESRAAPPASPGVSPTFQANGSLHDSTKRRFDGERAGRKLERCRNHVSDRRWRNGCCGMGLRPPSPWGLCCVVLCRAVRLCVGSPPPQRDPGRVCGGENGASMVGEDGGKKRGP